MSKSTIDYANATKLVVLLHGFMGTAESMKHVKNVVTESYGISNANFFIPELPLRQWSCTDPIDVCNQLLEQIDALWAARIEKYGNAYDSIVIVGHSFGALLGRKLYVYACGETDNAPFEPGIKQKTARPWAANVERIVLLAGMNRGWSISHHMSLTKALLYSIGVGLSGFWFKVPIIMRIRRGSPFVTNLRIQWLSMRHAAERRGVGNALTVQLLGSIDDLVSPEDNIDLVSGRDFIYLDVTKTNHSNIIEMDDSQEAKDRKYKFRAALLGSEHILKQDYNQLPQDENLLGKREDVTDLIFVIHGIRDPGYWTHKIARRVKQRGKKHQRIFETETSSYGYFPMLSFLFPWRRREKVEWLMDQYAEGLAQYPNAHFSYVGHSHGTYLLTKALKEYPCCQFKHVVLAGSVVRTDYAWAELLTQGRVKKVLNYVASGDWVVACFPNAMQMLNWQDLGGAGHRGFQSGQVNQIQYVKGAHSAALHEDNWDAIADFVIEGKPVDPPGSIKQNTPSFLISAIGKVAPLLWLGIIYLLYLTGRQFWPDLSAQQWRDVVLSALYVAGILIVLTKV
ncbi:esterase/lipase family protein [Methylotuvimicrobium sp. KM1]|uniref:esterase/lipase family protein n=1 Tax=Methylotuvimicrobium sp. KM1 TaxID=3377707 RepID=UPI0038511DD3